MLKSLYVDNYKTLVNFKIEFLRINILLGRSGTGKSTIFELLAHISDLIFGRKRVAECFAPATCTKWAEMNLQTVEIILESAQHTYKYYLEVVHQEDSCHIRSEKVFCDDKYIFGASDGRATLYNDWFGGGVEILTDWSLSGVSLVHDRPDNTLLQEFKKEIGRIVVCTPNPRNMATVTNIEENIPDRQLSNLTAFYRWLSQAHTEYLTEVWNILKEINPNFMATNLEGDGEYKTLQFKYRYGDKQISYKLSELSDGERMLFALYLLTVYCSRKGGSLFIDEPDNYLYLGELQPWLHVISDSFDETHGAQCILASHNPIVVDYLASGYGIWLKRNGYGAAIVGEPPKGREAMTTAELMMEND